jgi:chaperonin GroES
MNFIPLGERLLIEREEEAKTTASGIIIPDTVTDKPAQGKVVAIGADVKTVNVGDTAVFGKFGHAEVTVDGKAYLVLELENVLGIMK